MRKDHRHESRTELDATGLSGRNRTTCIQMALLFPRGPAAPAGRQQ